MATNKHYCQGTQCHESATKDRFQKSTGMLRGRYAYATFTDQSRVNDNFLIFCSQGCANDWLNQHTQDIINNRSINFITERRTTPGYEMKTKTHEGWQGQTTTYKTISKINSQNSNE
jgi:hypothetical protein